MKVLKIFLSLIISASFVGNLFAMEQNKSAEVKRRREGQPISEDELRVILDLVLKTIKSNKVTETELFNATNNLRLINKQFNSLIQEYIDADNKQNREKYKNLTKAQEYKQFQLDLIEELIKSKIQDPKLKDKLETLSAVARDLKAVRWMKESPLLKDARATFANKKYGDTFRENREAEIIYSTLIKINEDIKKEFKRVSSIPAAKEWFSSRKKLDELLNKLKDANSKIENDQNLKNLKLLFIEYKILLSFMLNYAENNNIIPIDYSLDALEEDLKEEYLINESNEEQMLNFKVSKDLNYDWKRTERIQELLYDYILSAAIGNYDLKTLENILNKYKFNLNQDINDKKAFNSNYKIIATIGRSALYFPLIIALMAIDSYERDQKLNLSQLNRVESIIKLLLKYGADPKSYGKDSFHLGLTPIKLAKEILKNEERKMSYIAQYIGYKVPAEILKLREIVKLLENPARADGFKPVSETGGKTYQNTVNIISNWGYRKDGKQEKK